MYEIKKEKDVNSDTGELSFPRDNKFNEGEKSIMAHLYEDIIMKLTSFYIPT